MRDHRKRTRDPSQLANLSWWSPPPVRWRANSGADAVVSHIAERHQFPVGSHYECGAVGP